MGTATTLFAHPASGHAWKVRQALILLGIGHRYSFVDLMADRQDRRPDFLAVSPFGEVPVLIHGGQVYAQSNAILLELARETGRLAGPGVHALERWLFWEANRVGFSVANLRWEMAFAEKPSADVVAMLRDRARTDLGFLDRHLCASAFVAGCEPSVADIACSAYLQFADEAGMDVGEHPHVAAWLSALTSIPGWEWSYDLLSAERADS